MATSDHPNMTASQRLLPETARIEGGHGEVKKKLDELQRRFRLQELQELAALEDELRTINAEFEKQREDLTDPQLSALIRENVEKVLRRERDTRVQAAQRAYQERKDERKKHYDEDKKQYKQEAYRAITALMDSDPGFSLHQTLPPVFRPKSTSEVLQTATPSPASPAKAAPPGRSQHEGAASLFPTQITPKTEEQPIPSQNGISDHATSYRSVAEHSQGSPAESSQQTQVGEPDVVDLTTPPAQPPAEPSATPEPAAEEEASLSESTISVGGYEQSLAAADPATDSDQVLKRKAFAESTPESPVPAQGRIKRTKLPDKPNGADNTAVDQPPPWDDRKPVLRTISFEEVYGPPLEFDKDGKEITGHRRHVIVQYPSGTGNFYILRCDEHGVHFGEHPLRGAAKHLHSAQHGYMSKAHATAIATLGHLVLNCTEDLAAKNNHRVMEAFKRGYKVFNANNLSQTQRAKMGFPPLDSPSTQKAAAQRMGPNGGLRDEPSPARSRKPFTGIVSPASCMFYLGCRDEVKYPVLVLPWGDLSPAGIQGTLGETGLFNEPIDRDGKSLGVPRLPKCYVYDQTGGRIRGIKGWANGYDSGQLMRKREFPVLSCDGPDYSSWNLGWIDAGSLSKLDLDDPDSQNIPFIDEAKYYYLNFILAQRARVQGAYPRGNGTVTPQQDARDQFREYQDIEMKDAGPVHNDELQRNPQVMDRDPINSPRTTSYDNGGFAGVDSRRNLPSGPSPLNTAAKPSASDAAPMSPATHARIIAAQALGLPAPARNGFTAVNAGPSDSAAASRSPSASLEPPSRADSVSSAGHRRVVKIHARGNSPHHANQGQAAPSIVLPERPADGALPGSPSPSQPSIARKPSPASLQNILQDFPGEGFGTPQRTQSPKPQVPQFPLPPIATQPGSPPQLPSIATINVRDAQPLRESRAGSAPVQQRDPSEEEKRRAGSASTAPDPARQPAPPSPAPAPQEQPAQATPGPSATLPQMSQFTLNPLINLSPLTTPTPSALNSRANSPAVQPKPGTPAVSFAKSETPTVPTMDVFDVGAFMEGDTEMFATTVPGNFLRLIDDHQSGVFRTADDAPVSIVVEPKKVKMVERSPSQTGATCIVKLTYHAEDGGGGEGRTQMLAFEKARSTASGMLNGVIHARRFCLRMNKWNPDVVCPSPNSGSDSINWRIGSRTPSVAPATPAASAD